MKPGSLVIVHKFEDEFLRGMYLGATRRFDGEARGCLGRFLAFGGKIVDVDLGNQLVYNFTVL